MAFTQGADVSSFQDASRDYFDRLKVHGAKFVFVKETQSTNYHNASAEAQVYNSSKTMAKTGAYHYLTGDSSARSQAGYFLYFVRHDAVLDKKSPVAIDVEDSSLPYYATSMVNEWLDAVYDAGWHNLVVYGSSSWFNEGRINKGALHHHPLIWVAAYGTDEPGVDDTDIWQYTDNGHGLNTDFDYLFNDSKLLGYEDKRKKIRIKPHYYQKGSQFKARVKVNQYGDIHLRHKTGKTRDKDYVIFGHIVLDGSYPRIKTKEGHYYTASVAYVKRLN